MIAEAMMMITMIIEVDVDEDDSGDDEYGGGLVVERRFICCCWFGFKNGRDGGEECDILGLVFGEREGND